MIHEYLGFQESSAHLTCDPRRKGCDPLAMAMEESGHLPLKPQAEGKRRHRREQHSLSLLPSWAALSSVLFGGLVFPGNRISHIPGWDPLKRSKLAQDTSKPSPQYKGNLFAPKGQRAGNKRQKTREKRGKGERKRIFASEGQRTASE